MDDTELGPMMRARGTKQLPCLSTRQYRVQSLIARDDGQEGWHDMTPTNTKRFAVRTLVKAIPDKELRAKVIHAYNCLHHKDMGLEHDCLPWVKWVEEEGRGHGIRRATVRERQRATGQPEVFQGIGGDEWMQLDLTGNHFDPDVVAVRLHAPLRDLVTRILAGESVERHVYPAPRQLVEIHEDVKRWVLGQGDSPDMLLPFPAGLERLCECDSKEAALPNERDFAAWSRVIE